MIEVLTLSESRSKLSQVGDASFENATKKILKVNSRHKADIHRCPKIRQLLNQRLQAYHPRRGRRNDINGPNGAPTNNGEIYRQHSLLHHR